MRNSELELGMPSALACGYYTSTWTTYLLTSTFLFAAQPLQPTATATANISHSHSSSTSLLLRHIIHSVLPVTLIDWLIVYPFFLHARIFAASLVMHIVTKKSNDIVLHLTWPVMLSLLCVCVCLTAPWITTLLLLGQAWCEGLCFVACDAVLIRLNPS